MAAQVLVPSDPWWQARRGGCGARSCADSPTHGPVLRCAAAPVDAHAAPLSPPCAQPALYEPLLAPLGDALAAAIPLLPYLPPPGLAHALTTVLRTQARGAPDA